MSTPAHAGSLLQALGDAVVPVQVEDDMAWMPAARRHETGSSGMVGGVA